MTEHRPRPSEAPDLAALFERHQRGLLAAALRITGDFGLAEDVLQETFLQAHRAAGSTGAAFRGEAEPGTWLYRIAVREALHIRETRARRREHPIEPGAERAGSEPWAVETARLLEALDRVREEDRTALVLLSVREIDANEIADLLGVAPSTVYTRAFRARQALRAYLGDASTLRSARTPVTR